MKLMIAKIVYWAGVVSMIGIALGMAAALIWFVITTIPFALFILLGFAVLILFGLAMGWAETQMDRAKGYQRHAK
jgi:hypothetical protein